MNDQQRAERKAKRFYISLVLLLFAIQFTIGGIALKLAIGDPALAVVPDYHQAALNWDESQRASKASERLGWNLQVAVSEYPDASGRRAISVEAKDEKNTALETLSIAATVYRHADAGSHESIELPHTEGGRYLTMAEMPQSGVWQIEFSIEGADEPMTLSRTLDLEH